MTGRGCWTCSSVGDNTVRKFASSYVTIELWESLVCFHQAFIFFFISFCTQKVFLFLRRLPLKTQCIVVAPGMPAPAMTPSLPFSEKTWSSLQLSFEAKNKQTSTHPLKLLKQYSCHWLISANGLNISCRQILKRALLSCTVKGQAEYGIVVSLLL